MEPTVQQVVDDLAAQVGRPVILEDGSLRLVAFSSHDQAVDEVREASILRRRASVDVTRWLTELGVRRARRPFRVPANPELGMLARLCIPILWKNRLLGHLWLIDAEQTMEPNKIELCVQHAAELATVLHRESLANALSSARLADAVRVLLSSAPKAAEAARLLEADFVAPEGVVAVVVRGTTSDPTWTFDIEDPLAEAFVDHLRTFRREPALHLARMDHGVLLVASPSDHRRQLGAWVTGLTAAVEGELRARRLPVSVAIGVGGHRHRLEDAVESFREARMAADAAAELPGMDDPAYWSDLGVNQIVVKLASMGEKPPVVHPGLGALLDSPEAHPMIETLETYLDVAGNAQLTAERLNLHRTSLYYRLQRVEQLANTDLKDGLERLALHLAIKLARLTGEYDGDSVRKARQAQLSKRAG